MNERIKRLFEIKKESQLPETLFLFCHFVNNDEGL